jgi:hypothetical protein
MRLVPFTTFADQHTRCTCVLLLLAMAVCNLSHTQVHVTDLIVYSFVCLMHSPARVLRRVPRCPCVLLLLLAMALCKSLDIRRPIIPLLTVRKLTLHRVPRCPCALLLLLAIALCGQSIRQIYVTINCILLLHSPARVLRREPRCPCVLLGAR